MDDLNNPLSSYKPLFSGGGAQGSAVQWPCYQLGTETSCCTRNQHRQYRVHHRTGWVLHQTPPSTREKPGTNFSSLHIHGKILEPGGYSQTYVARQTQNFCAVSAAPLTTALLGTPSNPRHHLNKWALVQSKLRYWATFSFSCHHLPAE